MDPHIRLHISVAAAKDGSRACLFWEGIGWLSSGWTWNAFLVGNPKNREALAALRDWVLDTGLAREDALAYQSAGDSVAQLFRKAMPSVYVTFGTALPIRDQSPDPDPTTVAR